MFAVTLAATAIAPSAEQLLTALAAAPDQAAASSLEQQITTLWLHKGSPAVTLLITRGVRALQAGAFDDAIQAFSDAVTLDPGLAEAYYQRALAHWRAGDLSGASADAAAALQREPRHFGALRVLAGVAEARGDWKAAYGAWRRLLVIDPKTAGGDDRLKDLRRRALGEET